MIDVSPKPFKNPIDTAPTMEDFKRFAVALKAPPEELENPFVKNVMENRVEVSEPKGSGPNKKCFLIHLDRNALVYYKDELNQWRPEEDTGVPLIQLINQKRWERQAALAGRPRGEVIRYVDTEILVDKLNHPDKDPGTNSSYYDNEQAPHVTGFSKLILRMVHFVI